MVPLEEKFQLTKTEAQVRYYSIFTSELSMVGSYYFLDTYVISL